MSRTSSLESLKQRIADMKSKIEETEERESLAKAELVIALNRQLASETEARSLANRVETLGADVTRASGKKADISNQLDQNALRSEESESNRKKLEVKEEEDYERSQELESAAKLANYDKEEKENKLKDAVLREKALESDLKRVDENLRRMTEKAAELQNQLDDMNASTEGRENTVNALSEKEDDAKEKIAHLDDQLKQVTGLEEERNAKGKTTERYKQRLQKDIDREKERITEIEKQFEELETVQ